MTYVIPPHAISFFTSDGYPQSSEFVRIRHMKETLAYHGGNLRQTALSLGWSRSTLNRVMKQAGVKDPTDPFNMRAANGQPVTMTGIRQGFSPEALASMGRTAHSPADQGSLGAAQNLHDPLHIPDVTTVVTDLNAGMVWDASNQQWMTQAEYDQMKAMEDDFEPLWEEGDPELDEDTAARAEAFRQQFKEEI